MESRYFVFFFFIKEYAFRQRSNVHMGFVIFVAFFVFSSFRLSSSDCNFSVSLQILFSIQRAFPQLVSYLVDMMFVWSINNNSQFLLICLKLRRCFKFVVFIWITQFLKVFLSLFVTFSLVVFVVVGIVFNTMYQFFSIPFWRANQFFTYLVYHFPYIIYYTDFCCCCQFLVWFSFYFPCQ